VRDGVSGFASTDLGVLVERMRELLADRRLAQRLSEGARAQARALWGLERFAADWTVVLEEAVRRRPPAPATARPPAP
jgi:hypothetical protein